MILEHFGLRQEPFGTTPDSRYLFESETHREALASLLYGIEAGRGFMALIAKPGMGKTTLLFRGLRTLRGKTKTVFLFQTISNSVDFLRALLADLGVRDLQRSFFELQATLNGILLEQARRGERLVVVIDETQNLDESVLEFVRMLSNFETQQEKLIQIILSGQPQLARKLASPSLVQLQQRISIVAQLRPLSEAETKDYIDHRLRVAGYNSKRPLFTPSALHLIADHSEGIPRNINNLCFNAMSLGFALKRKTIDVDILREVVADLDLGPLAKASVVVAEGNSGSTLGSTHLKKSTCGRSLLKAVAALFALFAILGVVSRSDSITTVMAGVVRDHRNVRQADVALKPAEIPRAPAPASVTAITDGTSGGDSIDFRESGDSGRIIVVPPGATLYKICVQTMKSCHFRELSEIQRLNPWLTDLDHLESGRELRIPSSSERVRPAISKSQTGEATP